MRKKCPVFALIFLLTLLFYTPASAATEYGVIYDETDALGSQTLKMQGEQTLPQLTETKAATPEAICDRITCVEPMLTLASVISHTQAIPLCKSRSLPPPNGAGAVSAIILGWCFSSVCQTFLFSIRR